MADATETFIREFRFPVPRVMLYSHLITPRKFKDPKTGREGEPRFEASFLLPEGSDDLNTAIGLAVEVAQLLFPGRDLKTLRFPFKKAADVSEKDRARAEGHRLLVCKTPRPAKMSVVLNGKVVDINHESEADRAAAAQYFHRGVETHAVINFKAYEGMGDGVTAYVNHVLSLNRGEKIAGGSSGAEVFGGYLGITSDVDPTASNSVADLI